MEEEYQGLFFGSDTLDGFSSSTFAEYAPSKLPKVNNEAAESKTSQQKESEHVQPDPQAFRMHRFVLYETVSRFYLVGIDVCDSKHQILKIDRTVGNGDLNISEDGGIYSKAELHELLNAIDDGNRSSGGLKLRTHTWGLLGFIRFTGDFYMLLVTKRSSVAIIGGHYVYQIDGTELIPLASPATKRTERYAEETRFVGILKNLDLTKSFYFSYTYDVTNTLQKNIGWEREHVKADSTASPARTLNEMFVWNHYLLQGPAKQLKRAFDWCIPIIHGFVNQSTLSIYGRLIYITIIARRSRFFAGARFLKRGANDLGYVANDVETEQIVADMSTTSFHAPGPMLYANPNYTSYVQHRGSIPLYWTQENTGVTPKPGIDLNLVDPYYSAAAKHFNNLFARYGAPIFVLNLVKARERIPRESKLLEEFTNAIQYLNQFLPVEKKILYRAWDMSRASKSRDQDVIAMLESIAEDVLSTTGFFHNGQVEPQDPETDDIDEAETDNLDKFGGTQHGVARTNCIDCLDRTNTAQLVIAKLALGYQLYCLGVVTSPTLAYDTDTVNLFTQMFHDHGDAIAIQYGGSHLVNTMETYRKINIWSSGSRDVLESVKRYYHNSFLDGQRQEAYNLFLGNYVFVHGQPMLWDLTTDYYLHHANPRSWLSNRKHNYIQWYDAANIEQTEMPPAYNRNDTDNNTISRHLQTYWLEYYKPQVLSSLQKMFAFRMNSTLRYIPTKAMADKQTDLSPFRPRTSHDSERQSKPHSRKGVTILEVPKSHDPFTTSQRLPSEISLRSSFLNDTTVSLPATPGTAITDITFQEKDRTAITRVTLEHIVGQSLRPALNDSKIEEYAHWLDNPHTLPLVVSEDTAMLTPSLEYANWLRGISVDELAADSEQATQFAEYLVVNDEPLTVDEEDHTKKRYKAYRQWLRGKSLFKQSRIDT
ncbi:MAG: hypothetical protein GOMPHAMPRED_007350 [Gomphillus americanus]|uniref:SAC domain-containing protein n=1 Tax=Gomphillus americanus TaxID=1940652 RepID=A0A8H3I1C4_9LECA|nr:MAG: hypothetical protein GOMPHAMPRED_007350 [Gomphillus americanus]